MLYLMFSEMFFQKPVFKLFFFAILTEFWLWILAVYPVQQIETCFISAVHEPSRLGGSDPVSLLPQPTDPARAFEMQA